MNIQQLLSQMRTGTFGKDFRKTVTDISVVVNNLCSVCEDVIVRSPGYEQIKTGSKGIVGDLQKSNVELSKLADDVVSAFTKEGATSETVRQLKQKLASSSYEIAKYTKELVNLL
eukprot:NODE_1_length_95616_cov_0.657642.p76 type:complete len:115 gc:universal NODE_1_length_95616_cov_0.657642:53722-53378(-)